MKAEVERWLSACIVAGHDMPYGDNSHVSFEVEAPTLEVLCRAWLALDGAVAGDVECSDAKGAWLVVANDAPLTKGQRVRIVPEDGQEVGNG